MSTAIASKKIERDLQRIRKNIDEIKKITDRISRELDALVLIEGKQLVEIRPYKVVEILRELREER